MRKVEFITVESSPDFVLSFAFAPAACASLILLRSPQYEHLLPLEERGVSVSSLSSSAQDKEVLEALQWTQATVVVHTQFNKHLLDFSSVG